MNNFDDDLESTIQRYLNKQLSEAQAVAFEDYFVDKPALIEQIESTRAMIQGLETIGPEEVSGYMLKTKINEVSLLKRMGQWLSGPIPAYSIAACAMLMLATTLWLPLQPVVPTYEQKTYEIELLNFSSAVKRNNTSGIIVELQDSKTIQHVAFIKLPKVDYRQYELSVSDPQNKKESWRSEPFAFSAINDKMISLPNNLDGASILLQLFGVKPNGEKVLVEFCHYSETCNIND